MLGRLGQRAGEPRSPCLLPWGSKLCLLPSLLILGAVGVPLCGLFPVNVPCWGLWDCRERDLEYDGRTCFGLWGPRAGAGVPVSCSCSGPSAHAHPWVLRAEA